MSSRADLCDRAPHPRRTVVVRGDRERPRARHLVVLLHQQRRGARRLVRIEALVDDVVDAHEAPAGRLHELPHARSADLRTCTRVERRLDVRQRCDLARQAGVVHRLLDVVHPRARSNQAFAEFVGLAELEAHPLARVRQRGAVDVRPPQLHHPFLRRVQVVAFAGGNCAQRTHVPIARFTRRRATCAIVRCRQSDRFVNDVETRVVVNETFVGGDLGVNAPPERDGRFQLDGARERLRRSSSERRSCEQQQSQQEGQCQQEGGADNHARQSRPKMSRISRGAIVGRLQPLYPCGPAQFVTSTVPVSENRAERRVENRAENRGENSVDERHESRSRIVHLRVDHRVDRRSARVAARRRRRSNPRR